MACEHKEEWWESESYWNMEEQVHDAIRLLSTHGITKNRKRFKWCKNRFELALVPNPSTAPDDVVYIACISPEHYEFLGKSYQSSIRVMEAYFEKYGQK